MEELAQLRMHTRDTIDIQSFGDTLVLCDSFEGNIWVKNAAMEDLLPMQTIPYYRGTWYVSSDLKTVYRFSRSGILSVYDLEADCPVEVEVPEEHFTVHGHIGSFVSLSGEKGYYSLNLETGEIEKAALEGKFTQVLRSGDLWFGRGENFCRLGETVLEAQDTTFHFLPERSHILAVGKDRRELVLYNAAGEEISRMTLSHPAGNIFEISMVWSESLGGYLFPLRDSRDSFRLMQWPVQES